MMPSRSLVPTFLLLGGIGCATQAPPQAHSVASKPASSAKAAPTSSAVTKVVEKRAVAEADKSAAPSPEVVALDLPKQCAAGPARCVPPAEFVGALCQRTAPEVALAMFKKGTPWTRAYMRLDRQLWFAGKKLSSPMLAPRGEELLILKERGAGSGIVIGGGSYDALRWNGTCVSVAADEVTLKSPGAVEVATIQWKYLPDATQDSLLENTVIKSSYRARMQKCRSTGGDACDRAERALSQHIAAHVRDGGSVADPSFLGW